MTIELRYTQEHLLFCTVRIGMAGMDSESMGTGVIVRYPLPYDREKYYTFLVSCRHVLDNPDDRLFLTFHRLDPEAEGEKPKLSSCLQFDASHYGNAFVSHPDPAVDLACIQLSGVLNAIEENSDQLGHVFFRGIEPKNLTDESEEGLLPGLKVLYVGYPEDEYDQVNNLPLVRVGFVASAPKVDYQGRPEFLIDGEVHHGSSGSPVFGVFGNRVSMLGIVTDMISEYAPVQDSGVENELVLSQVRLGLGVVIKAKMARELLDHAFEKSETLLGRNQ